MYDNDNKFEKKRRKNFKKFMKKNRLHVALAVFLLAAGTLTYFVVTTGDEDPNLGVQNPQSPTLEEQLNESPAPTVSEEPSVAPSETPEPSEEPASNQNATPATVYLTLPIENGSVIEAFSGEEFVYNNTLNMWTTHNGIDIACKVGDPVSAALAGTVKSVREDNTMGTIVEIEHTDKQVTLYAGFGEVTVSEGDKVNAGQQIGTAGTPAFEANAGAHVHFEYIVNGKYVDPMSKIQQG